MKPDPQSILESKDAAAYCRFLDYAPGAGWNLAIIKITLPNTRQALVNWTKERVSGACEVSVAHIDPDQSRLWDLLDATVRKQQPTMLILSGFEGVAKRERLFAQMNVERDELVRAFALPWILFVHPAHYFELMHKAPDFVDFANLWLDEAGPELPEARPLAHANALSEGPREVALGQDLLTLAANAIRLGRMDEARDVLARYDFEKPEMHSAGDVILAQCLRHLADYAIPDALQGLRKWPPANEHVSTTRAAMMVYMADILRRHGELNEAWRILKEQVLPAFDRQGDVRLRVMARGRMADILQARGERDDLDEALRIRRNEQLPVYEKLGNACAWAITQGKVADILITRGEWDEGLRILCEDALPVFERLGEERLQAITHGQVAHVLAARGKWEEAVRVRQDLELPVYERLGDVHALLVARVQLALALFNRRRAEDAPEVPRLLALSLADARRLCLPEARQIETIVCDIGLDPSTPPFV